MLSTIIYLIGLVLCIWCVYDLFKNKHIDLLWKIVISILLLGTSFLGLLIYYFLLKDRIK